MRSARSRPVDIDIAGLVGPRTFRCELVQQTPRSDYARASNAVGQAGARRPAAHRDEREWCRTERSIACPRSLSVSLLLSREGESWKLRPTLPNARGWHFTTVQESVISRRCGEYPCTPARHMRIALRRRVQFGFNPVGTRTHPARATATVNRSPTERLSIESSKSRLVRALARPSAAPVRVCAFDWV